MIFITKSEKQTKDLAGRIIKLAQNLKTKNAKVIALEGELGAGKTTLVKGLVKALGIKVKIKSPTFTLMKKYEFFSSGKSQINSKFKILNSKFYHLDCYRLRNWRDLMSLGIKDILKDKDSIVVIEWSERVKPILPKNHVKVHIDHISKNERKISIK